MANWITGREIIAGAKLASTWRTAVSLGSNDGLLITSEGFGDKAPTFLPDDSLGQDDIMNIYRTNELQRGSISGYARYDMWDVLLAMALGTAGSPSQLESTAYANTYSPAANIDGKFVTMAMKKAGTAAGIWELPSCKITGFTLSGQVGQFVNVSFDILSNKIETVSPVNSSLSSVTYRDRGNICKVDNRFKVRMNAQAGAALEDSDALYPFAFNLTYRRPFRENWEASYNDMSEPVQDGFAEVALQLSYDKYSLDTFLAAIAADTQYKMDILLEGDVITGSSRYTLKINIPKIMWQSGSAPVGGPGTIGHVVNGRPMGVTAAPTGMSGVTDPISIYVINTRTTDPLV